MHIPEDRHPSTRHFEPLFRYDHLPEHLQTVSKPIHDVAQLMVDTLADGPELSVGLRKLWEAKNSLVVHAGFCQDQAPQVSESFRGVVPAGKEFRLCSEDGIVHRSIYCRACGVPADDCLCPAVAEPGD